MKAEEIKQNLLEEKRKLRDPAALAAAIERAEQSEKAQDFAHVLRVAWIQADYQGMFKTPTQKDLGQIRTLHRFLLHERGISTPQALAFTTTHWESFAAAVKETKGYSERFAVPAKPQLGWMLSNRDVLADWYEDRETTSVPSRRGGWQNVAGD